MDTSIQLFPFAQYWWFYAAFTGLVLVLLALDLGVFHRRAREVTIREATVWTFFWIALSLVFNYLFYRYMLVAFAADPRLAAIPGFDAGAAAKQAGLEFLAGYVVEKALSVDNIFVFVVVLGYFAIPPQYQHRVLFLGILGALIFRAIFIALGAVLMDYQWVVILFGVFLIFTGVKMLFTDDETVEPEKNPVYRFLRRHLPGTDPLARYPDRLMGDGLGGATLRGYLAGSIDAVLRVRGGPATSFLVVDYKTNLLRDPNDPGMERLAWGYRPDVLPDAMIAAHYPLQALLYCAALHRFLRWRVPGYDPAVHLGGVLYLFVRGMTGPLAPSRGTTPCGVFSWQPPAGLVVELSDLLDGGLQ